ncbi:MAG: SDR family oxidoreductase [Breznakibacter sp.]
MADAPLHKAQSHLCALVTGSGKRIGNAISRYLAQRGYDVALHYNRSGTEAEELHGQLKASYPARTFPLVQFDLEDWQNVATIFDLLPAGFGRVSLLVNNASVFFPQTLSQTGGKDVMRNFSVHFFAPFMLMQEFHKRHGGGLVVNLLDTRIVSNEFSHAAYLLSKKTLAELTKMAAFEWAPHTRVNGIAPGPVLPAVGAAGKNFAKVIAGSPLSEAVDVAEITETIGYFLHCPHITGQIVHVDSGSHLT